MSGESTFKAIADPTRRRILDMLREQDGLRTGDIADAFPHISRQAVSKHLRILEETALIEEIDTEDKRERRYHLNAKPLHEINDWLRHYEALWETRLDTLKSLVETENQHDPKGD